MEKLSSIIKKRIFYICRAIAVCHRPPEDLAAYVVVYRALGINKEFAIICMEELSRRRKNGDDFEYEDYISEQLRVFSDITSSVSKTNLSKIINSVIKGPNK
jgi:hypothetical protein